MSINAPFSPGRTGATVQQGLAGAGVSVTLSSVPDGEHATGNQHCRLPRSVCKQGPVAILQSLPHACSRPYCPPQHEPATSFLGVSRPPPVHLKCTVVCAPRFASLSLLQPPRASLRTFFIHQAALRALPEIHPTLSPQGPRVPAWCVGPFLPPTLHSAARALLGMQT